MRTRRNKPAVSGEARSFRAVRRLNLNRTYVPIKIGVVAGYILLAMLSASTSMFGILVGAMLRIAGFWIFSKSIFFEQLFSLRGHHFDVNAIWHENARHIFIKCAWTSFWLWYPFLKIRKDPERTMNQCETNREDCKPGMPDKGDGIHPFHIQDGYRCR